MTGLPVVCQNRDAPLNSAVDQPTDRHRMNAVYCDLVTMESKRDWGSCAAVCQNSITVSNTHSSTTGTFARAQNVFSPPRSTLAVSWKRSNATLPHRPFSQRHSLMIKLDTASTSFPVQLKTPMAPRTPIVFHGAIPHQSLILPEQVEPVWLGACKVASTTFLYSMPIAGSTFPHDRGDIMSFKYSVQCTLDLIYFDGVHNSSLCLIIDVNTVFAVDPFNLLRDCIFHHVCPDNE